MQSKGRPAGDRRGEARLFRPRLLAALVAVFAVGLVVVPGAGAALGPVAYFDAGGPRPDGVVVNHSGTGVADPGDLYSIRGSGFTGASFRWYSSLGEVKGELSGSGDDISIDQSTGNVYVAQSNFVDVYSGDMTHLRRFGYDVVGDGPGNSANSDEQQIRVIASGGTFTLCVPFVCTDSRTLSTVPIPYDAPASSAGCPALEPDCVNVEDALNQLSAISDGGHVTVSGGPGDATGSKPYIVSFDAGFTGDDANEIKAGSTLLTGSARQVRVVTTQEGGGYEVCVPANGDTCGNDLTGLNSQVFASHPRPVNGALWGLQSIAVAPSAAANAGNILTVDGLFKRVSEFTADGGFLRSFGWDVNSHGPNDSSADERQLVTLGGNTTGGKFSLLFNGVTTGAVGNGDISSGQSTVTNVSASNGAFAVGQVISAGAGIPAGTTITAVDSVAGTLGLSAPASQTAPGTVLTANDIAHDAPASQVEAALNSLPTITGAGGSVSVSGANGGPYTVAFGGAVGGDDVSTMTSSATGLSVSGGSKSVSIATVTNGGDFEVCVDASGDVCKGTVVGPSGSAASNVGRFRGRSAGITQDSAGVVYVSDAPTPSTGATAAYHRIQKFTPSGAGFVPSIFGSSETQTVAVSATAGHFKLAYGSQASGITADIDYDAPSTGPDSVEEALNALPPIAGIGASVSVSGGPGDATGSQPYEIIFDGGPLALTDPAPLAIVEGTAPLSGGSGPNADQAVVSTTVPGGPSGLGPSDSPVDVAVDDADNVFVSKYFPAAAATCPDGTNSPAEVRIQRYDTSGAQQETSIPCVGIQPNLDIGGNSYWANLTVDPISGEPYLAATGGSGAAVPGNKNVIFNDLGSAPVVSLNQPSNVSARGVTISGSITPNGPVAAAGRPNPSSTTYRLQYKKATEATWNEYAPATSIGVSTSPEPFSVGVSGLTPNTTYDLRVIANKLGHPATIGSVQTITTAPAPPSVDAISSSDVTATSADLHATINPLGTATSYHFEYGKTPAYGNKTPEVDVGDSLAPVEVQQHIEGLEAVVYHFRVVATNTVGTTASHNQTFNFYPEPCPNEAARQQTGSGGLPDCRAYELVSPEDAGAATLQPGTPNSPHASSPPRLSFLSLLGTIPGPWNPPNRVVGDMYVTSRSSTGWSTRYVGLPADLTMASGGPPNGGPVEIDAAMSQYLVWNQGSPAGRLGLRGSMAPYVYGADGEQIGRLPTNLAEVPTGTADVLNGGFVGDVRPSTDFSHYFFSAAQTAFAPGGLTSDNGSVYDNDVETGTVTIVSKEPGGGDIPEKPGDQTDDYMNIPDVSDDGSHALVAVPNTGVCGEAVCDPPPAYCDNEFANTFDNCPDDLPSHLYMRVGGAVTYDVSGGNLVNYEGMTADGSAVFFTSAEQITPGDTDTSVDLYKWSESTDSITRLSAGNGGVGNTDACNAAWVEQCGVEVIEGEPGSDTAGTITDNAIAAESGDVFFYSPEQFEGSEGIPGRRNLFVSREGQVHYVTTLDADKPIRRLQVSPDGVHAAFVTTSRLTAFDNTAPSGDCEDNVLLPDRAECRQMFVYDVVSDDVRCVSCNSFGERPSGDVEASQSGLFMSDDGRAFFSTPDPLVPEDTNGLIDVYEYVDGRPHLISSGVGSRDTSTQGVRAGLVGVSANGVDVYFANYNKLVARDDNGQLLRIYDARTNGGFPVAAQVAPCEAADECHGTATDETVAPRVSSSAALAGSGNARLDRCATMARSLRRTARRFRVLRSRVRRMARHAGTSRLRGMRAATLRKRMRGSFRNAKRTRAKVRRCRVAQRARANRRAAG